MNIKMQRVIISLKRHLTKPAIILEKHGSLYINNQCYVSANKHIFRLLSRLDWVHYEPVNLAHAIDTNTIADYYEAQLQSPNSYQNDWQDTTEELDLKTYYANRVGRKLDKLDNI